MTPDVFDRIEFWSIGREPLNREEIRTPFDEEAQRRSMHVQSVRDDQKSAPELALYGMKERGNLGRSNVAVEHRGVETESFELRSDGERGDDREPIVAIPTARDWGLSARRPSPSHDRLEHEARFVNEDETSTLILRFS